MVQIHCAFYCCHCSVDQSFSGLALTYVVALSGLLQFCVRQSAEVESLVSSFRQNYRFANSGFSAAHHI